MTNELDANKLFNDVSKAMQDDDSNKLSELLAQETPDEEEQLDDELPAEGTPDDEEELEDSSDESDEPEEEDDKEEEKSPSKKTGKEDDDPLAELRAQLAAVQKENQALRSQAGRVPHVQRKLDELDKKLAQLTASPSSQASAKIIPKLDIRFFL